MIETIAIYYTPIAATKTLAVVGLGLAYHMSLVYTNSSHQMFGATSGPSNHNANLAPQQALVSVVDMAAGWPSQFGMLVADTHNNTPFEEGGLQDVYTQDAYGVRYAPFVVMRGANLSAQWQSILETYVAVSQLHLTYSPISQNSNSMAGTALMRAGIQIPFSSATKFAPAVFTHLPLDEGR